MRSWPPLSATADGETPYSENFASLNRNKRSVALDLKDRAGVERLLQLAEVADLLVENYRPGVLERLGAGYEAVSVRNPRIVYCSISGYGQTGPYARKGAFDRHRAGHERSDERDRRARRRPGQVRRPGRRLLRRALRGLHHHRQSHAGEGDRPGRVHRLLDARQASSPWRRSRPASTSAPARRRACSAPRISRNAPYQAFRASDEHFIIAAGNESAVRASVRRRSGARKCPRIHVSPPQQLRAEHQDALAAILGPKFAERRRGRVGSRRMDARGVPCAPINDYPRVLDDDPQVAHLGLVHPLTLPNGVETRTTGFPVAMSGYDFAIHRPPPALGAHTAEVLEEWLGEAAAESAAR